MTGSFLFVKPYGSEGKRGTAYSGNTPSYSYDHASWEWLLERTLRRMLLPWALTKSHSRALLYGHEDKYSMHRWGAYGDDHYNAGKTPSEYSAISGPGTTDRKTDADLSSDDRSTPLPELWNSQTGIPTYSKGTMVTYGVIDLEKAVANLPFSLEWLHPDWSSGELAAWDLTASTKEETQGSIKESDESTTEETQGPVQESDDGYKWEWKTTVEHTPYNIPEDGVPFKCLSHMRTDDPTVRVRIMNDDNEMITVETARTPISVPRTTNGGSIIDYHGTRVRRAARGAAYGAGWALSEFYVQYRHGLDYGKTTSSAAYGRDGKTAESKDTIGCLVNNIPSEDSGKILVDKASDGTWARFVPEVNWNGKQTWWHANDFPKGLDSVLSPKLRSQLKALCPICQPAIPPAVPAFYNEFPDAGSLSWEYPYHDMYQQLWMQQLWMQHLALACTPFDMSARLDAMTTTVHKVPKIFAKIRKDTTYYYAWKNTYTSIESKKNDDGDGGDNNDDNNDGVNNDDTVSQSSTEKTYREEATTEGTSPEPIPTRGTIASRSNLGTGVSHIHGTYDHAPMADVDDTTTGRNGSWSDKTKSEWEDSFKLTYDFIVCLRETANTKMSTKTTRRTTVKERYPPPFDPYDSEEEWSSGDLPDSNDPDPDDLLFPDWVLPWIDSAELFASITSYLFQRQGADYVQSESHYTPHDDPEEEETPAAETHQYSGSGSGKRTHEVHRKIVSLGNMSTSTGRFPAFNVEDILLKVDPVSAGFVANNRSKDKNYDSKITEKTDTDGNYTKKEERAVEVNILYDYSRAISYYVVVKWKFDRTDPKTLATDLPLANLYRKLADAEKALADKKRELKDAKSALVTAEADFSSAEAALALAKEKYNDPESAEDGLLEEAQAALDAAKEALEEAQEERSKALSEETSARSQMESTKSFVDAARAAYDAAVEAGEEDGIEGARAALEDTYTAYYEAVKAHVKASSKLADAEADAVVAQLDADAAQEYYDTLHEKIMDILDKAVKDAEAARDEANSRVKEWKQKVGEAEDAIPSLEAAVEAAKQAISDAIEAAEQAAREAE